MQADAADKPYAEALVADLDAHIDRARTDWLAARDAIVRLQALRAEVRIAAEVFNQRLSGLRRTLRAVLDPSHHDYQALRVARVRHFARGEEAEGVASDAPVPGTPNAVAPLALVS